MIAESGNQYCDGCGVRIERRSGRCAPCDSAVVDRLAREFWERCVLAMIPPEMEKPPLIAYTPGGSSGPVSTRIEVPIVEWADHLTKEWRKRFDPPKETP